MVEPGLAETRVWWSVIDPRTCHIVQWFEMRGTGGRPTPRCAGCVLEECTSCGFHRARNGAGAPLGLRCWAPRQMNLHDTLPVLTYLLQPDSMYAEHHSGKPSLPPTAGLVRISIPNRRPPKQKKQNSPVRYFLKPLLQASRIPHPAQPLPPIRHALIQESPLCMNGFATKKACRTFPSCPLPIPSQPAARAHETCKRHRNIPGAARCCVLTCTYIHPTPAATPTHVVPTPPPHLQLPSRAITTTATQPPRLDIHVRNNYHS